MAGGVQLGKVFRPNIAVVGVVPRRECPTAAAIIKSQGAGHYPVAELRHRLPQQGDVIQHKLQVLAQGVLHIKLQLLGQVGPVQLVPGHSQQAVQPQPGQPCLGARLRIGSHGGGVFFVGGIVPHHKVLRRGALGGQGCLQSTGAQCIVGIQKDDKLTVRGSQSAVACTRNT